MATHQIRQFGDPVLKTRAADVTEVDGRLVRLVEDMIDTMYDARGVGLAAPQVGVQKRLFVYDLHDDVGPRTLLNPSIVESDGEWTFEEGCLSIPGLFFPITRPRTIHLVGVDLHGNEVSIEAEEYEARVYQHEIDHLEGRLLLELLEPDQHKEAMRVLRNRTLAQPDPSGVRAGQL